MQLDCFWLQFVRKTFNAGMNLTTKKYRVDELSKILCACKLILLHCCKQCLVHELDSSVHILGPIWSLQNNLQPIYLRGRENRYSTYCAVACGRTFCGQWEIWGYYKINILVKIDLFTEVVFTEPEKPRLASLEIFTLCITCGTYC